MNFYNLFTIGFYKKELVTAPKNLTQTQRLESFKCSTCYNVFTVKAPGAAVTS